MGLVRTFPSVPQALKILDRLKGEVKSTKSFEKLAHLAKNATDIQRRFKPIKEVADKAGQIRIEADLRLEEELRKLPKAKGTRGHLRGSRPGRAGKGAGQGKRSGGTILAPPDNTPTLAELGVDKKWAARARSLSRIPNVDRTRIAKELEIDGEDVTPANILKKWKEEQRENRREQYAARAATGGKTSDLQNLIDGGQRFSTIYADPPWEFKVYSGKGKQRSAERHYDTMSLDDIKALPIEKLAAEDCALFLWMVWPELPGALEVIKAWGFEYKTAGFVWVKSTNSAEGLHWGMGYWTRANTEVCLLATRGSPTRLATDVHQVVMSLVGEHSEKPEEVRKRIEKLVPGPRIELFSRRESDNWVAWGNEIQGDKEG
jgi:N6-adenosine-specific RNA methylase IME4